MRINPSSWSAVLLPDSKFEVFGENATSALQISFEQPLISSVPFLSTCVLCFNKDVPNMLYSKCRSGVRNIH